MRLPRKDRFSELEPLLGRVLHPARYLDHEWGACEQQDGPFHVCMIYADTYEVGQPNLGIAILYNELNKQIATVRPGSDGLLFLPYLNGERCPHRNADISGVFWGLSYHTERKHMARAVMEGVTYALLDALRACQSSGVEINEMIALGGGANSREWLQMQADMLNVPLRTTVSHEQAVLGAAISAAVGCGAFSSYEDACDSIVRFKDERVLPRPAVHDVYEKYYAVYRDIYQSARPALERVTELGRQEEIQL